MSRNKTARMIDATYRVGDVWIVQRGHEADAELLKQAMDEIDRLQDTVDQQIDEINLGLEDSHQKYTAAVQEYEAKRDQYAKLIDDLQPEIKRIRNAAKALVSNIDKTSFHEEEQA